MLGASFLNRAMQLYCCTVITVLDTSNGAHRKPFPAATPSWELTPRPRSKHEKRTVGSTCETWTVAAADCVGFARVRWEINFLLTFETAPFICKHTVFVDLDSVACIVTHWGLDGPVIESQWVEICHISPDRPWGPPSSCTVFTISPGKKAAGAWPDHSQPSRTEVKERLYL